MKHLMKLNRLMKLSAILCVLLSVSVAEAKPQAGEKMTVADKAIKNLATAMAFIEKNSSVPVVFPKQVPQTSKTTLYAVTSGVGEKSDYSKHWWINAANSATCATRGCIVGSVDAEKDGKLELSYVTAEDQFQKPIPKEKVALAKQLTGYYTPGHAEADWHMPSVEWSESGVLYHIAWDMKGDAKKTLIEMANTAITKR